MEYEYVTTLWGDFTLAEIFGTDAIEDTAERVFDAWKDNIQYITEFVMILNHKCWYYYEHNNASLSELYANLYYKYDEKVIKYLDDNGRTDDLNYFFRTLD